MENNGQVIPVEGDQDTTQGQSEAQSMGWRAALPDEFKEHEYVKTFNKPGDFVKDALNVKTERDDLKTRMETAIFKPGEDATPEQKEAFLKSLGRPDDPKGYELVPPKLPEGLKLDDTLTEWYRQTAFESGLNKEQAARLYDGYNKMLEATQNEAIKQRVQELEAGREELKKEWGNDYDKNVAIVQKAQEAIAGDEATKNWLTAHNAENNPVLVRLLFNVGKLILDDTEIPGSPSRKEAPKIGMNYTTMKKFEGG